MTTFNSAKYIPTIDTLLKIADLDSISAKKIRHSLEDILKENLNEYKKEIDKVIIERYMLIQKDETRDDEENSSVRERSPVRAKRERSLVRAKRESSPVREDSPVSEDSPVNGESPVKTPVKSVNSWTTTSRKSPTKVKSSSKSPTKVKSNKSPSKSPLKVKNSSDIVSDSDDEIIDDDTYVRKSDEQYAAELHAQLNERRSRNSTRKARKPKSTNNRGPREKKELSEKQKNNPFQAPLLLSPNLRLLLGEAELSRPQTVKAIWKYIKENNLQNPENKREILCDERMKPVFGNKTDIFKMNSILAKNLFKKDEIV